jgi:hypothetical protein
MQWSKLTSTLIGFSFYMSLNFPCIPVQRDTKCSFQKHEIGRCHTALFRKGASVKSPVIQKSNKISYSILATLAVLSDLFITPSFTDVVGPAVSRMRRMLATT